MMAGAAPDANARATSQAARGRGLVLVNPSSGKKQTDLDDMRARFRGHDVEVADPNTLTDRVREARKAGALFVGIAGGDGTIRSAAEELAHGETALLPIPEGTANHFARTLGIETLDDAVAATTAEPISVDLGRVNDRGFVNNASIGFYPYMVDAREKSWLPRPLALVVATIRALIAGRRISVTLDRRRVTAWLVFVGNDCYGEDVRDIGQRDSVDEHLLDVRVVRADQSFARLRLFGSLLVGRIAKSKVVERRTCRAITVDVAGRDRVDVALDGEVLTLTTPLRFESDDAALRVLSVG
jgi:diacylglycerol kinase family enzyme